jgi:predicted nucleic acid-binding protein
MKVFFDSNAVLALLEGGASAGFFDDLAQRAHDAVITDLIAAEAYAVAWRDGTAALQQRLPGALAADFLRETPEWADWWREFEVLVRRYQPRIKSGTNDLLHLAAARLCGCDGFASLDVHSGLRAMAHTLGFRVYPALDSLPAKDSPLLRKLRF